VACKQAVEGQKARVQAAVAAEWAKQAKGDKDLSAYRLKFALAMGKAVFALGKTAAQVIISHGVLMHKLVGAARTIIKAAVKVYGFLRDLSKAGTDIINKDAELWGDWSEILSDWKDLRDEAGLSGNDFAKVLAQLQDKADSDKSVKKGLAALTQKIDKLHGKAGALKSLLDEHSAKNAALNNGTEKLYGQAESLMSEIADVDEAALNARQKQQYDKTAADITALLNKIGDVQTAVSENGEFNKMYADRLKIYQQGPEPGKLAKAGKYAFSKLKDALGSEVKSYGEKIAAGLEAMLWRPPGCGGPDPRAGGG